MRATNLLIPRLPTAPLRERLWLFLTRAVAAWYAKTCFFVSSEDVDMSGHGLAGTVQVIDRLCADRLCRGTRSPAVLY